MRVAHPNSKPLSKARFVLAGVALCIVALMCWPGAALAKPYSTEMTATAGLTTQAAGGVQKTIESGTVNASSLAETVGPLDTIELSGNTVLNLDADLTCAGINDDNDSYDLTIAGDKTLAINTTGTGIRLKDSNLTIESGTVSVAAGSHCLYSYGNITISGGVVTFVSESYDSIYLASGGGVSIDNADVYCKGDIYTTGGASGKGITIGSGAKMTVVSNGARWGTLFVGRDTVQQRNESGVTPSAKLQIDGNITSPEGASVQEYLDPAIVNGQAVPGQGSYWHVVMKGDEFPAEVKINGGAVNAVKTMITEDMVSGVEDKTFTGSPIEQAPVITDGDYTLGENTDYKLVYSPYANYIDAKKSKSEAVAVYIVGIGKYAYVYSETFMILPAAVTPEFSFGKNATITWDGNVHKPGASAKVVYNGKTYWLARPTDFVIEYSGNCKDVGKYTATMKRKGGNFTFDDAVLEFEIVPEGGGTTPESPGTDNPGTDTPATDAKTTVTPTCTLSDTVFTWDGSAKMPDVTVKAGAKSLVKGTDYDVSYSDACTDVGAHSVTVSCKGGYSFSPQTLPFTIDPKGAAIAKPKAAKKVVTVNWKAQKAKMSSARITGYQVQVATDKGFAKGVKQASVKGFKKTSVKVKKLKAKKKYYVRVCTYMKVDGTTYYSPWSAVKNVKTK